LGRRVFGNERVVLAGSGFFVCERIHAAVRAWKRKVIGRSVGADPCTGVTASRDHPTRGPLNHPSLAARLNSILHLTNPAKFERSVDQFNPGLILIFVFNESLSPSIVNLTFLYDRPRDTSRIVCAMKKAGVVSILFVVVLLAVAVIADAQ